MASILNIPFNFQPVGNNVATSTSYTVPSGKYAFVRVSFTNPRYVSVSAGTTTNITPYLISLNGNAILYENTIAIKLSGAYLSACTLNISAFNGYYIGDVNTSSASGSASINNLTYSMGTTYTSATGSVNNQIQLTATTTSGAITLSGIAKRDLPDYIELWCKAGDVIMSTGGTYRIQYTEYNNIS